MTSKKTPLIAKQYLLRMGLDMMIKMTSKAKQNGSSYAGCDIDKKTPYTY